MLTIEAIHNKIESAIRELTFPNPPASLYAPITYTLDLGGKRIRPTMMLLAYNMYKDDVSAAVAPAIGLEMFHNFTLLHDDLMDDADKRRGKPTVHKAWCPNVAILSGDAMTIAAYELMAKVDANHLKAVLDLFSKTALEICGGQQYDMEFETRKDVLEEEYVEMIRLKTAVLLGCALKMGALLADAPKEDQENLYDAGIEIGLAFQLQDDLLDVYGDPAVFGKKIGGDILCNKKTYMLINALNIAKGAMKDELLSLIESKNFEPTEKIAAVTRIYNELGIRSLAEKKIEELFARGMKRLNSLSVSSERSSLLTSLLESLLHRTV
jgi:geranylgeranyl diphosphate synthase type II